MGGKYKGKKVGGRKKGKDNGGGRCWGWRGLRGEWGKGRNGLGRRVKMKRMGGGQEEGERESRGQEYFNQKGLLSQDQDEKMTQVHAPP